MLNKNELNFVSPLALRFASENKLLVPLEGSPLESLMSACTLNGLFHDGKTLDNYGLVEVYEYLEKESISKTEGLSSDHSQRMDNCAAMVSKGVSTLLDTTRNIVVPDIKDVLEKVQQLIGGHVTNTMDPFTVVMKEAPKVFWDPLLVELVERFSETPAREVTPRQLPSLGAEVIREKVKTGADGFDSLVGELLDDEGVGRVGAAFNGGMDLVNLYPDLAIALHLLCKNMHDDPPEGTRMSLMDYNGHISRMIEQSGRMAYHAMESHHRRRKIGSLYTGPSKNVGGYREIEVDGAVYRKLLEEGLVPEALFGNELTGRRYMASQLMEVKDDLVTIYNREMRMRSTRHRMEQTSKVREFLDKVVSLMINERDEDMLPADRATLHKRLADYLAAINDYEFDNLPVLCRNVVCHVFYAHTDAKRLIVIGDRIGEEYPDLEPREVMLMATIEYISVWVAKQICLSKI